MNHTRNYKVQLFDTMDLSFFISFLSRMLIWILMNVVLETKEEDTECAYFIPMAYSSPLACQMKYTIFVSLLLFSTLKGLAEKTGNASSYPVAMTSFSTPNPQIKYAVFVNFRGSDIRQNFLSHLIKSLSRNRIIYFVDDKLEKGGEISQGLLGAIERSLISLVIFSPNYATSRWCLDELVKIVECREKDGQIVLPVFYNVTPSDVRHQKGTYETAFSNHTEMYGPTAVQTWRSALKESATLSGFHSSYFRNDSELVEEIVKSVSKRLNHTHQVYSKGLVGIAKPIAHVESLLRLESSEEVRVVGIWGMGGIGKTTIAEEVFNKLSSEYDGCCFLANVREEWGRNGRVSLKQNLFSKLLGEEDLKLDTPNGLPNYIERRLRRMKVLVVLDDVNESEQFENLVGSPDLFGSGSRIIVTTRDKQVLTKEDAVIYEVEALEFDESLRLLNLHAFRQNHIEKGFEDLSKSVVKYARGIPLVLKILGGYLHKRDKEFWESLLLNKLKKGRVPNPKVHDVIKLSYDDLDRDEKKIFLDIACFFDGLNLKVDYVKLLLKDRDYSVAAGLERLKDKALVAISQDNVVSMHNIIQETAWDIVRQESIDGDPGKRSRLMDPHEIYQVLKYNKGSELIRSITINLSSIKELQLSPQVFSKMIKLQFIDFYNKGSCGFLKDRGGLYLPQGLQYFPNELRYLRWAYYPLMSLPTHFFAEKLVVLSLPNSRMKILWDGKKNLPNLKVLVLHSSTQLMELPNLLKATNLKAVDLRFCIGLTSVHPSIFSLDKLEKLDLGGCVSLQRLKSSIQLSSLRYLSLFGCISLKEFSVISKNMKKLNLEMTSTKNLPSSIGLQSKLEKLRLGHTYIKVLPMSVKNLTRLRVLDLRHCKELHTLPVLPSSLKNLDARGCTSLKTVLFPPVQEQLKENRKSVAFWNCLNLDQYSLMSIGINAKVNMMRSAFQDLSTLGHDRGDYDDAEVMYVYPGNRVPEWFLHKTTSDYLIIDVSSYPQPHQLGFILCFIIPAVPSDGLVLKFYISNGEDEENSITVDLDRPLHGISSDHLYIMYNVEISQYLRTRVKGQTRFRIKVKAISVTMTSEYVPLLLRGFGVNPINATQYHNFVQQMELSDIAPSIRASFDKYWKWVMQLERYYVGTICLATLLIIILFKFYG